MLRFGVRRLLLLIPILIGLSVLLFLWIRALPGSPATALLGERATAEQIAAINERLGLNDPIWEQYWAYLRSLLEFDFGESVTTRRPVFDEFMERFPATIDPRSSARPRARAPVSVALSSSARAGTPDH